MSELDVPSLLNAIKIFYMIDILGIILSILQNKFWEIIDFTFNICMSSQIESRKSHHTQILMALNVYGY